VRSSLVGVWIDVLGEMFHLGVDSLFDLLDDALDVLIIGTEEGDETDGAVCCLLEDPIGNNRMKVRVCVERRPPPLHKRHRSTLGVFDAHRACDASLPGKESTCERRKRETEQLGIAQ
jgi:hypothetical protein